MKNDDETEKYTYIFRASIRLCNGKRIYAHQFGLKAFKIKVKNPDQLKLF
jgi:hypothetical protein